MRSRPVRAVLAAAVVAVFAVAALPPVVAAPPVRWASGIAPPGAHPVVAVPAARTPHVLNGRVYSVAQVGHTIVLGGTFSRVREDGRSHRYVRRGLVAFDARTGRIDRRFAPDPRGGVRVVLPGPDGRSVYVGGGFTSIGGTDRAKLALLRVSDGGLVTSFDPGRVTGEVKDLALTGGRLWVAGAFTHLHDRPQRALATVSPRSGAPTSFMSLRLSGNHTRGVTQVLKLAAAPDGSRLVAIGNFDRVAGVRNHQLAVLDLRGRRARPSALRTRFYTSRCSAKWDSTMRDVDVSPDGRYFVVATTGGYGEGPPGSCDTVARFELDAVGAAVRPSWVDYTGGDTTYSVEVTGPAVYVGGHERWWNNPGARNRPGPGAVARAGIASLDPLNGLPLDWNPGRSRGVGVFDFLMTGEGLWVASDTDRIAVRYRARIARFPLSDENLAPAPPARLPGRVYLAGSPADPATDSTLHSRTFDGRTVGPDATESTGGVDWATVRGAFMIADELYVAHPGGRLTRQSFDGATYGVARQVSTADLVVPLSAWRADVRNATGMFFDRGRIYFTLAGSHSLFYRYFSPASGVVGAQRFVASRTLPGSDYADVRGLFVTSSRLFWATPDGRLHCTRWSQRARSGVPTRPLGPTWSAGDSADDGWAARALFLRSTSVD